jgi:hypothetical protein
MYNLYIYEKQLLKNEKERKDLIKEKNLKKRRKKELCQLTRNYNNRMNDFILTMCQNPIFLYNQENPYNYNTDIVNNMKKNHFSFGDFKTDKQRVESLDKENKLLKKYDEKRKNEEKKRNIAKIKNHRNLMIIQPKMRFNSRTKLEHIIEIIKKKEENSNIDIYNSYLVDEMKRLKYNNVKKIKEYNYLIDKDKLNNKDLKKIIKILNENEQYENNNEYTLKNYIDWKYLGIVSNNYRKNYIKSQQNLNYNNIGQMLELIGNKNKNKNEEKKNEFECLVKDDFKTHFKGASQYISLKDENDLDNGLSLIKDKIQNSIKDNELKKLYSKKRSMSALKLNIANKSMKNLFADNKGKPEQYNNNGFINKKKSKKKRPVSVIQSKYHDNNYRHLIDKNQYSIKDLGEKFKIKKLKMKELMNKEINNSLITHYTNKYAPINLNRSELNDANNILIRNDIIMEKETDKDLKEKLTYLQNRITQEKRMRNKDKYKNFVKRFARSAFGFRNKEILKKQEDFNQDKKSDFVVIDGKIFKKDEMKKIAELIFQKCNFYRRKKIYND